MRESSPRTSTSVVRAELVHSSTSSHVSVCVCVCGVCESVCV